MPIRDRLSYILETERENLPALKKLLKAQGALALLMLIRKARILSLYVVAFFSLLMLMFTGLSFLIVQYAIHARNSLALSLTAGLALVIIPLIILLVLFSTRSWLKAFEIDKLIEDLETEDEADRKETR